MEHFYKLIQENSVELKVMVCMLILVAIYFIGSLALSAYRGRSEKYTPSASSVNSVRPNGKSPTTDPRYSEKAPIGIVNKRVEDPERFARWKLTFRDGNTRTVMGTMGKQLQLHGSNIRSYREIA